MSNERSGVFSIVFAAAFATHHTWETFLVGLAASASYLYTT